MYQNYHSIRDISTAVGWSYEKVRNALHAELGAEEFKRIHMERRRQSLKGRTATAINTVGPDEMLQRYCLQGLLKDSPHETP